MREYESKSTGAFVNMEASCLRFFSDICIDGIDEITFEDDPDEIYEDNTIVMASVYLPTIGRYWFDVTTWNLRALTSDSIRKHLLWLAYEGDYEYVDFDPSILGSEEEKEAFRREGIVDEEGNLNSEVEDEMSNEIKENIRRIEEFNKYKLHELLRG